MQRPDVKRIERERPGQKFTDYAHITLSVGSEEAVDALASRLVSDGYPCLDGPRHIGESYYESAILDPEGHRVEITV